MTPLCDFHVHTSFCDGRDEPEKMVFSAVEKGVERLGLVVHSYVEFDPGMPQGRPGRGLHGVGAGERKR